MKHLYSSAVLMVAVILILTGCVTTTTAERASFPSQPATDYLGTDGQAVKGHKIVTKGEHASKVCFTTAKRVPGGRFCVVMSNEILEKKVSIASIYWHGDGIRDKLERTNLFSYDGIFERARRIVTEGPMVAVIRPHSSSKYNWRQMSEIQLHIAMVEYINQTFGVERVNPIGHSGGAIVAIGVAQERPKLTAAVWLASPKLAVGIHYTRHEGKRVPPSRYWDQYDPIRRLDRLSPKIPVLIAYSLKDPVIKPGGVLPYVKKAERLGKKVKLILAEINTHYTQWFLGEQLQMPENQEFLTRK